jgi:hypothetical protein
MGMRRVGDFGSQTSCSLAAGRVFKVLICAMVSFAGASALGAEHRFDGVYNGKRVLTKGAEQMCPIKEDASVTIHGETLPFTIAYRRSLSSAFS